ncbi:hypothetical protein [Legionella maioricensis]|uniref:Uncharacterized protein n=1 Tax=Legionella maioricensis TaxID=2896528 RepID=A0A9X2D2S3_9GAMM|nr:hypothetical protein [Legionella maioricensis]MCL9685600.1 hypothetical protein [Legionella maioricensis]MCL9689009.1 hypothetical protein [Legionella maioricensis]
MDPISIALICAASFGAVVTLAAFIRMMILSRDKELNDEAQRIALTQEAEELERMREQMQSNKRFDSHYKVLGANKDAIVYLDTKIEDILHKKTQLIDRYAQVSIKESEAIVDGALSAERKAACDRLKLEIDEEIKFYDRELANLQLRRTSLWDTHTDLQEYLLAQEQSRNENLDFIYKQHSGLLEKVYIRHIDNSEHIAKQTIDAGTSTFKTMVWGPIQFLLQYFNLSTGVSLDQSQMESDARDEVEKTESDVNDLPSSDEVNGDKESDKKEEDSKDDSDKENDSKLLIA